MSRQDDRSDYFAFSHTNRYAANLNGRPTNRFNSAPFEMSTSTQHRQFHEMRADMTSDVLELFKSNEIGFLKAPVKPKCRSLDPVTTTCHDIVSMFGAPNIDLIEPEQRETR